MFDAEGGHDVEADVADDAFGNNEADDAARCITPPLHTPSHVEAGDRDSQSVYSLPSMDPHLVQLAPEERGQDA